MGDGTGWEKNKKAEVEKGLSERWEEAQGGTEEQAGTGNTREKTAG